MSTNKKQDIYNAVLPLKGKWFKSHEELEDAFLPYFGSLQSYFQGEGHRDLVDRLFRVGWIVKDKGGYLVKLEEQEQMPLQTSDPSEGPTPVPTMIETLKAPMPDLSYSEAQMLDRIVREGGVMDDGSGVLQSLQEKSLVSVGYTLTPLGSIVREKLANVKIKL